jgi:hypothetical protein
MMSFDSANDSISNKPEKSCREFLKSNYIATPSGEGRHSSVKSR